MCVTAGGPKTHHPAPCSVSRSVAAIEGASLRRAPQHDPPVRRRSDTIMGRALQARPSVRQRAAVLTRRSARLVAIAFHARRQWRPPPGFARFRPRAKANASARGRVQTCPLSCPPDPSNDGAEPKCSGIIIRVSGVRVPPPACAVPANRQVSALLALRGTCRIETRVGAPGRSVSALCLTGPGRETSQEALETIAQALTMTARERPQLFPRLATRRR